jgi:hypothetical protein
LAVFSQEGLVSVSIKTLLFRQPFLGKDMIATCLNTNSYDISTSDAQTVEATFSLELRRGLPAGEVDRRIARANRASDVGARTLAFYLVDLAERGAHQELGFHSVEQYAQMRYGIQPSTTREYLAVGRALEELPETDEALCQGHLLWSQARLIARVGTPETEAAWVEWAVGKTVREIEAQVRKREKGELPTDPARRRIHTTKVKVEARFNVVQLQMWNNAKAKLEAETGRPASDAELMLEAAKLLLETRPDGTVPGRTPVNDSHFSEGTSSRGRPG